MILKMSGGSHGSLLNIMTSLTAIGTQHGRISVEAVTIVGMPTGREGLRRPSEC